MNLLLNGAEAIQGGGRVSVVARANQGEDEMVLEVHDTGVGIPPENFPKIFEPFFTTKEGKGVGLGLAVAYGIVQAHAGDIEVESAPGKGTTFRVTLPLSRKVPVETPDVPVAERRSA
jgi:signal transduction histidine kinase